MSKSLKMLAVALIAATATMMAAPASAENLPKAVNVDECGAVKYKVVNNGSKGTVGQIKYLKRCIDQGGFEDWDVSRSPLLKKLAKTPAAKIEALAVETGQ